MNVAAPNPKLKHRVPSPSAEERSNDLERRRELGQFFTPVGVAGFMWELLEIIQSSAFPANTRLIDPACGDGVFLRVVNERGCLRAECLFGADIDETLVSKWRSDSMLSGAAVHLMNGLVDDPAAGICEGTFDVVAGNPPFSGKGLRELLRLLEDDGETERHEEQDLFGSTRLKEEPAAPCQSLSHRERAELDRLVKTLSQYACWRLNAPAAEGEEADSEFERPSGDLFAGLLLSDKPRPTASDYERTAQLISRWPVDRLLDVSRTEIRDVVCRLASTAIEVFFMERFVRLARPGGLIAVIVPESIVASDRLAPLRRWLAGRIDLLASISLPQKVFTGVGANAKTTILFARQSAQKQADPNRLVLLTAPRLDSPLWSLENYLESVLQSARRERNVDWPQSK